MSFLVLILSLLPLTGAPNDDRALGHLIVVSQYAWPKYSNLFLDVVKRIQRQGAFTYHAFFSYVVNVDILEEFAFLRTPEGEINAR